MGVTRYRRNAGKRTGAAQVEANIVAHLRKYRCGRYYPVPMSTLGEVGFPGYDFKRPQGAAFAVSKIVRSMCERWVLGWTGGHDGPRGYYLREL